MPLLMYPAGQAVMIKQVSGQDDTRHFLQTLGFVPGEFITVVSENGGNMIVSVKNTRVALDKTLARRIMV